MLYLYYADVSGLKLDIDEYPLSSYRLSRLKELKPEINRRQSVGAELLLNAAVRELLPECALPLDIGLHDSGKPFLKKLPYYFSLSHSGCISACALSDRDLGLDVQKPCPYNEKFALRFFSAEEQKYILNSADRDLAFTCVWSAKESFLKYTGAGIRTDLNSFSTCPGTNISYKDKEYRLWCGNIDAYSFSICSSLYDKPDRIIKLNL